MMGDAGSVPRATDFLRRKILTFFLLTTVVLSVVLFLSIFTGIWHFSRKERISQITLLERDWLGHLEALGRLLNAFSERIDLFRDDESIATVLKTIYKQYDHLASSVCFGSSDGRTFVYPPHEFQADYDPRARPWYGAALGSVSRDHYAISKYFSIMENETVIGVSKAVVDERGNVLGVIRFNISPSRVAEHVLLPNSYIVDETGQILASGGSTRTALKAQDLRKIETTTTKVVGTVYCVVKPSIVGTYLVLEDSFVSLVLAALLPSVVVSFVAFVAGGLVVKFLRDSLVKNLSQPLEGLAKRMKSYLIGERIDFHDITANVYEVKTLLESFSEMIDIVNYQVRELEETYGKLQVSHEELREAYALLKKKEEELKETYKFFTEKLAMVVEGLDELTGKHARRLSKISRFLAEKLGLPQDLVEKIELYTPLHDIGKIYLPREILTKPGRLTEEEYEMVKKHTLWGATLLSGSDKLGVARNIVLYHHERYDGSGYPFGLKEETIPIEAQIVGLADVYDALRSERPYKRALSHEEAMMVIFHGDGRTNPSHFSPRLLKLFAEYEEEIRRIWESE